jgi:hypothetical protein
VAPAAPTRAGVRTTFGLAGAIAFFAVVLVVGYSNRHSGVAIRANGDSRVATDGFYPAEQANALTWTWTKPHATLSVPALERGTAWTFTAQLLHMRPPGAPSPAVRITVDNRAGPVTRVVGDAAEITASIPEGTGRGVTIALDVSPAFVPGGGDSRELGVAVGTMSLRRERTLAWPPIETLVGGSLALAALWALLLVFDIGIVSTVVLLFAAAVAQVWLLTRPALLYAPYPATAVASYLALLAAIVVTVAASRRPIAEEAVAQQESFARATPRRSLWYRVAAIATVMFIYAIACRVMLAPVFNFNALSTASYEGDARGFIWVLAWDNHVVLDRAASLFDANVLYPLTHALAYSEHVFAISLFTLPIYAATRNPVLAYNLVWIVCFLTTAAAVHALAWRRTQDHLASIVAGVSFTFCFFRMQHAHHIELIWCAFIPLSFIAIEWWVDRPTWGRLATVGAIVVAQALSGWYEAVLIAIADMLFLMWLFAVERRTIPLRRAATHGIVAVVAAMVVVWPFARHYFTLHQASAAYSAGAAADFSAWLVPPENTFAGQWLLAHGFKALRPIWGEVTVYLGWVTLLLAAAGTAVTVRKTRVGRSAFFVVLALVAAALALGPSPIEVATGVFRSSPFGVLSHVPGISLFRNPARYTQLVSLALAVLAAVACAAAHRRFGIAARVASVAVIGLLLTEIYVVKFPGGQPQPYPVPAIYQRIATLPAGAVLSLPDYANTPLWFLETDYQYFSTAHWHPIVNGDAREFPPQLVALKSRLLTFPSPDAAAAMRDAHVEYVVLHGAHSTPDAVAAALASPDYELLATIDADRLFRVRRQ